MAIMNKILLKDKNGKVLLPITKSTLVELKSTTKTKFAYLDAGNLSHYDNVDDALSYLHDWQGRQDGKLNNLVTAINEELPEAFHASHIAFDNSAHTQTTDPLYKGTEEEPTNTYNVQGAIEALASEMGGLITQVEQAVQTAGVTSVVGSNAINVTGTDNNGVKQGAVGVELVLDGDTLTQSAAGLKVNKVSADDINVTEGSGPEATTKSLTTKLGDIDTAISELGSASDVSDLQTRMTAVETAAENANTKAETISLTKNANAGDYAAVYTFTSYNGTQTTINIPKDQFLQSAEYVATAPEGATPAEAEQYPAIVFTWVVDTDNDSPSPTNAQTIIPVADLIASADTKADQALEVLGVERDENDKIIVPNGASAAISNKETVEEQIQGLDAELQSVAAKANTALQGVDFNGTAATVTDNVAYITANATNLSLGELTNYDSDPSAITGSDSIAYAISKLAWKDEQLANSIVLSYIDGGETEEISNGFAGIVLS